MKQLQWGSNILLALSLVVYGIYRFTAAFPDWVARVSGVGMLLGIGLVVFTTRRMICQAEQEELQETAAADTKKKTE